MGARPTAASARIATFTATANTMFWWAIRSVWRAMRMATATSDGLSSISTTSAASMAASDPMAPIAMPTSARASTGASFMPSPTNARVASSSRESISPSTWSSLSWGRSSAWNSSIPSSRATTSAVTSRSPVSMTVRRTPCSLSARTACPASGFTSSETCTCPAYAPSTATCTTDPPSVWQVSGTAPTSRIRVALPTATRCPFTVAKTPRPASSVTSLTTQSSSSSGNASLSAAAIGWVEFASTCAARCRSSSSVMLDGCTCVTLNVPFVSVPVLSNTTVCAFASASR